MLAYRRTSETANALLIGVWEADDLYIKYCRVGNWNNSVAQSKPLRAIAHIALAPQSEEPSGKTHDIPGGPVIIGSTPIMSCDFNVGSTPSRSSLKINGERSVSAARQAVNLLEGVQLPSLPLVI